MYLKLNSFSVGRISWKWPIWGANYGYLILTRNTFAGCYVKINVGLLFFWSRHFKYSVSLVGLLFYANVAGLIYHWVRLFYLTDKNVDLVQVPIDTDRRSTFWRTWSTNNNIITFENSTGAFASHDFYLFFTRQNIYLY